MTKRELKYRKALRVARKVIAEEHQSLLECMTVGGAAAVAKGVKPDRGSEYHLRPYRDAIKQIDGALQR